MRESSYREGFEDGWFFDDKEMTDSDYIMGRGDGKRMRIESEQFHLKLWFEKEQVLKKLLNKK